MTRASDEELSLLLALEQQVRALISRPTPDLRLRSVSEITLAALDDLRREKKETLFDEHETPTRRVDRPVELAPPCPKLRRYRTERGGWSIDSGGERVWDPALEETSHDSE